MSQKQTLTLEFSEILLGGLAGLMRRVSSLKAGLVEPYGWDSKRDPWSSDIHSACAEMAVAKMYNRYWQPAPSDFRSLKADVGEDIHVRSTKHKQGSLILHDRDKDGWYCLVIDEMPKFTVVGWKRKEDGCQQTFWRDPGTGRPAYFVPQRSLDPAPLWEQGSRNGN